MNYKALSTLLLSVLLGDTVSLAPNSWQKRLDKAFLDVDGARNPQARFRSIQRALKDPNLPKDISRGIDAVREKGMGKGHPELIDALWPKGTIAREDIEGIQALTKSIPERVKEIRNSSSSSTSASLGGVIQALDLDIVQRVIRESSNTQKTRKQSITLAQNVLRRNPKSVNFLPFKKLDDDDTLSEDFDNSQNVKIRTLEETTFYACKMESNDGLFTIANMGSALIKLSNSILEETNYDVRNVVSPFIIRDSSMYIWKKDGDSIGSEAIRATDISLETWPACTLALIEFSGICTDGEIERQSNLLKEALTNKREEKSQWKVVEDSSSLVLQYNAPGTLPWRRKNQLAFVVEKDETSDTLDKVVEKADTADILDEVVEEVDTADILDEVVEEVDTADTLNEVVEKDDTLDTLDEVVETVDTANTAKEGVEKVDSSDTLDEGDNILQ